MQILILYRELASYLIPSLEDIVEKYNAQLTLVVYEVNADAPYLFSEPTTFKIISKTDFMNVGVLSDFQLVFCSGWADKEYLTLIRNLSRKTVKVICFDSEFQFTLRKLLGVIYLRLFVKREFNFSFVPGSSGCYFAKLMGFSKNEIFTGIYSANISKFSRALSKASNTSLSSRPRRFLFVGRYVKEKGIQDVCNAFVSFIRSSSDHWELWCVGTGPERENCHKHEQIKHFGFLQPNELIKLLDQVDIFVMPSHLEPWGVVLHEMVLAGLPILVSDKVNSREIFLDIGVNGFEFEAGSVDDLLSKMIRISLVFKTSSSDMITRSRQLGLLIANDNWSSVIAKIIE